MNRHEKLAMLGALCGNSIFGFSFMFTRVALKTASPSVLLMYRFLLAAAILLLVAAWAARYGEREQENGGIHWLRFSLKGKPVLPLVALGVVQPVIYFLCENYGIRMTNATFSGVIIALTPIAALGAGALALYEFPNRAQIIWSLVSIAGVALMTLQQNAEGAIQAMGVVLLVCAVLSGVTYSVLTRKISDQYSALERTVVMMLVAAVIFSALALVECRSNLSALLAPLHNGPFVTALLYLSVLSSVVAFLCINYASSILPVARTTSFCNLTTVISMFAGVIFLGEPFGPVSLTASAMIVLGVWQVQKRA